MLCVTTNDFCFNATNNIREMCKMGIFDGKVAIITGGGKAKSIGYGIAVAYAKEGANLVLTGRRSFWMLRRSWSSCMAFGFCLCRPM